MISDDQSDNNSKEQSDEESDENLSNNGDIGQDSQPRLFDLNGPTSSSLENENTLPTVITDEDDRQGMTPAAELLRIHYDFNTCPSANYSKWV